jgi:hypothetical protein
MTLRPQSFAVPDAAALGDAPRPEPRSAIAVTREGGALVIVFPAARNPSMALGMTAFSMLWTGAIVFMVGMRAPWFFPVVFGLFDVLISWIVLTLWLEVIRVRVDASGVAIASGLVTPGPARVYTQVKDVRVAIGMTSGTTAWYDLKLVLANGREVAAGGGIRHKREAEWIAAQMLAALGQARRA